ncbi:purine-nucleoside phosphorylase [Nigerium massiliense]|uniref:purine-nucleoside phosphorylase n=1 Tax=Nigerium massiliense TaxID=1522317 RepID=UPI00058BE8E5|nr:purine-nucleoside phosphorylase [Nigerium massiliense]
MNDFDDPTATAHEAAGELRRRLGIDGIDVGLVLGSGWATAAEGLGEPIAECPLAELPGFSAPVVAGHGGQARAVRTPAGRIALILTGRTHFYEGRGVAPVVHGVRTVAAAGATRLVLTNGCGGLNPAWTPGTPVLISDHINLTAVSPLRGATFVDLTDAYSHALRTLARGVDPGLDEGVYVQFPGPHYETPAEVRMARTIGGDLVGMSTALETIAAREAGLEVLGISLVTNAAAGLAGEPLSHAEVVAAGQAAVGRLRTLLAGLLEVL